MIFLPVVTREMYVAARRRSTYSARVGVSALALVVIGWLLVIGSAQISSAEQGRLLFIIFSTLAFVFCLLAGAAVTADCLSEEKREGTLGLLFLTDLRGYDLVLGKLASSSLKSVYGLLAIIPMLSLALLLGGVTAEEVGRVVVVLINTLLFSLAAGVLVSTISRNERKAMFATAFVVLAVAAGPWCLGFSLISGTPPFVGPERWLLIPSPILAFVLAFRTGIGGFMSNREFWYSLITVHVLSWVLLALSSAVLPSVCLDRPRTGRRLRWWERWQRWSYGNTAARATLRARLLDVNPILWLAGRDRLKRRQVWMFLGALVVIGLPAWFISVDLVVSSTAFLLFCAHSVLKIWLVSEVCSRWMEDRRSGALELLLSSPLSVTEIARGQKLALRSQFGRAVGVVLGLDLFLLVWAKFYFHDPSAQRLMAAIPAGMIMLVADWITLRWLAMWLALTSKSMSQALLGAWMRVLALPWLAYLGVYWTLALYFQFVGRREPNISVASWTACWLSIGLVVDWLFGSRARHRFLHEFREVASERFIPRRRIFVAQLAVQFLRAALEFLTTRRPAGEPTNWVAVLRRHAWLGSALGLALVAMGWFGWYRVSLSRQIRDELAAVQKAGYPTTEAEVVKWHPPIPIGENLVSVIALATPKLYSVQWLPQALQTNLHDLIRTELPVRRAPLPAELKQAISAFVSSNQTALNTLRDLVDYRKSRHDSFWTPSPGTWWGPVARYSEVIQLLRMEALLRVDEREPDQAIQSLNALLSFARSMAQEPLLQVRTWRNSALKAAASILERLMTQHSLTELQLRELSSRFSEIEVPNGLTRALAGDRFARGRLFDLPAQPLLALWWGAGGTRWQMIGFGLFQGLRAFTGIRDRDHLLYLQTMKTYMEVTRLPYPENLARANQLMKPSGDDSGLPLDLTRRLLPSLQSLLSLEAEKDARLRAIQTSFAVERYRLKNPGRLPETLSQLVPAYLKTVPADPFDGKPLRYQRLRAGGYVVYSVAADQKDDGGREALRPGRGPRDLTFIVER